MKRFLLGILSVFLFQLAFSQKLSKPNGIYFNQTSFSEYTFSNALRNSKMSEPYTQAQWEENRAAVETHNSYLEGRITELRLIRNDLVAKRQQIQTNRDLLGLSKLLKEKRDSLNLLQTQALNFVNNYGVRANYLLIFKNTGALKPSPDLGQKANKEISNFAVKELNETFFNKISSVENGLLNTAEIQQRLSGKMSLKGAPYVFTVSSNKKALAYGTMLEVAPLKYDSAFKVAQSSGLQTIACINMALGEIKVKELLKLHGFTAAEITKLYQAYTKSTAAEQAYQYNQGKEEGLQKLNQEGKKLYDRLKVQVYELEGRIFNHKILVKELLEYYEMPADTSFSKDLIQKLSDMIQVDLKPLEDSILLYSAEKYESYDGPIIIKDNLGADLAKTAINGFRLLKARKALTLYSQQTTASNGVDTNFVEGKDFTVIREVKELWLMPYLGPDKTYRIGLVARYKLVKGNPKADDDLNLCRGCTESQKKVISEIAAQMVHIPGGDFTMGCKARDNNCQTDEKPTTLVSLNNFMINRYEVTQRQFITILGSNPSYHLNCPECPVEEVSWDDAQRFISKLNELTGKSYRLPTEAEWEFAAAGGKDFVYAGGDVIKELAWYAENSSNETHPVGQNAPNSFGLYDMSGNVWEWCSDWYSPYQGTHVNNPQGPTTGSYRVIRGGSWNNSAKSCRVSTRFNNSQSNRFFNLGFRLAHGEQ